MILKSSLCCLLLLVLQFLSAGVRGLAAVSSSSPLSIPSTSLLDATATTKVSFSEVFIDDGPSCASVVEGETIGQRIKYGETIVELNNLATAEECQWLVKACIQASSTTIPTRQLDKPGLVRLPTIAAAERAATTKTPCADPLPVDVDIVLQRILRRATEYIDQELPTITSTLFGNNDDDDDSSLTKLLINNQLKFSSREPAINIYTEGGEFLAHKDAQALTLLLPLSSSPTDFTGGGTAFWGQDSRGHRVEDPSLTLKPNAGTAMLFGGCVTHSGIAVDNGCRVVFVASFSPKDYSTETATTTEPQRDIYGDSM